MLPSIFKVSYAMLLSDMAGGIWGFFRIEDKIGDSIWRSVKAPITEKSIC